MTKQIINRSIAALALSCAMTFGYEDAQASSPPPKWRGSIDLLGFPMADGTIQRSDMLIPLVQGPNTLSYLNLRNEWYDDGFAGFSAGVGLRHRMNHFIVGVHGFVDWRETDHSGSYRQFSAGAELLGEHWDLRFNAYLPEDSVTRDTSPEISFHYDTHVWTVTAHAARNLPGIDAEFGVELTHLANLDWGHPLLEGLALPSFDVWAHAGGFHYIGEDGFDDVSGYRGRLEIGFNDLEFAGPGSRLSVGVEGRHDETRDTDISARLRLRIPFSAVTEHASEDSGGGESYAGAYSRGLGRMDALDQRMTTPVVRWTEEVLSEASKKVTKVYDPAGREYTDYMEVDNAADLRATDLTRLTDNVTFITMLSGTDDETGWDLIATDFETHGLGDTYALAGKASPIRFDSPFTSERLITQFTPRGTTPTLHSARDILVASGDSNAFTFKPGDHINGWDIDGTNSKRVTTINRAGDYYITNTIMRNGARSGLLVNGIDPDNNPVEPKVYIWDSTFRDNGEALANFKSGGVRVAKGGHVIAHNVDLIHNFGNGAMADDEGLITAGIRSILEIYDSNASYNGKAKSISGNTAGLQAHRGGKIIADNVTLNYNGSGEEGGSGAWSRLANRTFGTRAEMIIGRPGVPAHVYNNFAIGNNLHGFANSAGSDLTVYNAYSANNFKAGFSNSGDNPDSRGQTNIFYSMSVGNGYGMGINGDMRVLADNVIMANNTTANGIESTNGVRMWGDGYLDLRNSIVIGNGNFGLHANGTAIITNTAFIDNANSAINMGSGSSVTISGSSFRDNGALPTFILGTDAILRGSGNIDHVEGRVTCEFKADRYGQSASLSFVDGLVVDDAFCQ